MLVFLSLLVLYHSCFFKGLLPVTNVTAIISSLRIYVSSGTILTGKSTLESHKSLLYPAKGQRKAAIHQQHCRAIELIPGCTWGASWCLWQRHNCWASVTGWAETTEKNNTKQCRRDDKVREKLHMVTSPGNTDKRNDHEPSRVTSTGQSTSPVHDTHQLYSEIELYNRAGCAS